MVLQDIPQIRLVARIRAWKGHLYNARNFPSCTTQAENLFGCVIWAGDYNTSDDPVVNERRQADMYNYYVWVDGFIRLCEKSRDDYKLVNYALTRLWRSGCCMRCLGIAIYDFLRVEGCAMHMVANPSVRPGKVSAQVPSAPTAGTTLEDQQLQAELPSAPTVGTTLEDQQLQAELPSAPTVETKLKNRQLQAQFRNAAIHDLIRAVRTMTTRNHYREVAVLLSHGTRVTGEFKEGVLGRPVFATPISSGRRPIEEKSKQLEEKSKQLEEKSKQLEEKSKQRYTQYTVAYHDRRGAKVDFLGEIQKIWGFEGLAESHDYGRPKFLPPKESE